MDRQRGISLLSVVIVLAVLAAAVWFIIKVVAPPIIEREIEARATEEWGAEVNVGRVAISLWPLGATVYDIQMTDHNRPQENLVVIESAFADPDVIATLKTDMKPILERVEIAGVQMHQPRQTPGRVLRKPDPIVPPDLKQETEAVIARGLPDFKLPDPKRILEEERLETVEVARQLQQQLQQLQPQWEALKAKLPNEKTLERLKQQLAQLQKQGLNPQALQQFEKLKADIAAEQKKLEEARAFFARLETLQKQFEQLRTLPQKDLERLRQRYSFDVEGTTRLVETLLGTEIQPYVRVVQRWLDTLRRLTAEKTPKPDSETPSPARDVLVRLVTVNGQLPSGRFDAEARNVTLNQAFYGVVTPYQLRYFHRNADGPVVVKGEADLQNPQAAEIRALLEGVALRLHDLALVKYPTLSLALKEAAASIEGRADVLSWEKIQGEIRARFKDVAWALLKTQNPDVQRYLAPVLEQVQDFSIQVGFSGSLYAPRLSIRTDLDRVIGSSLQKLLRSELKRVEQQLAAELRKRAEQKVAELAPQLKPLLSEKVRLDQLDRQLETLLRQELEKQLPQKQLEEKAKEELLKNLPALPGGLQLPKF